MLLVKTTVAPSPIHGLGLFADEDIPKGTTIWKFNPTIDKKLTSQEIEKLPEHVQNFIDMYAYFDEEENAYFLGLDNDRFVNHSEDPNVEQKSKTLSIALRDIKKGEEITENYREFDANAKKENLRY